MQRRKRYVKFDWTLDIDLYFLLRIPRNALTCGMVICAKVRQLWPLDHRQSWGRSWVWVFPAKFSPNSLTALMQLNQYLEMHLAQRTPELPLIKGWGGLVTAIHPQPGGHLHYYHGCLSFDRWNQFSMFTTHIVNLFSLALPCNNQNFTSNIYCNRYSRYCNISQSLVHFPNGSRW